MQVPIEDFYEDVLGKAARGLGLSTRELSEQSGIDRDAIRAALRGNFVEDEARKLAPILALEAEALVLLGNKSWRPAEVSLSGLTLFNSTYGDMTVNAYVIWDPETREAAVFDSGADATEMLSFLQAEKLSVQGIWVTHTHGDHVVDIANIRKKHTCPVFVGDKEMVNFGEAFEAGRKFAVGSLNIETRLTWGHAKGGITYFVTGLERPIAVVGDALFAQSMGGGLVSYEAALETTGSQIMTLPDNTIICPGHGPMTSVGEEKKVNPFFAASVKA